MFWLADSSGKNVELANGRLVIQLLCFGDWDQRNQQRLVLLHQLRRLIPNHPLHPHASTFLCPSFSFLLRMSVCSLWPQRVFTSSVPRSSQTPRNKQICDSLQGCHLRWVGLGIYRIKRISISSCKGMLALTVWTRHGRTGALDTSSMVKVINFNKI